MITRPILAAAAFLATLSAADHARADGEDPAEREGQPKHVVVAANPLSLVIARYSAQVEVHPFLHHAVTLNIRGNSYRLKEKLKAGLVRSDENDGSQPGGEN